MLSGKCPGGTDGILDQDPLDKGEQAELAHLLEWFGPLKLSITARPCAKSGDESVMKMWERGDIPGVTGQGAGEEATGVVDQETDDNFDNILRKPGCRGTMSTRGLLRGIYEGSLNPG